jgi:hypothetical protein
MVISNMGELSIEASNRGRHYPEIRMPHCRFLHKETRTTKEKEYYGAILSYDWEGLGRHTPCRRDIC